jgi:peptidoglycan biosynthesis protein MviN/MurJ (putative lipid II flippase)
MRTTRQILPSVKTNIAVNVINFTITSIKQHLTRQNLPSDIIDIYTLTFIFTPISTRQKTNDKKQAKFA